MCTEVRYFTVQARFIVCLNLDIGTLTCVGKPPAVGVVAQQAAKAVTELVQVHLGRSNSYHLQPTEGESAVISQPGPRLRREVEMPSPL